MGRGNRRFTRRRSPGSPSPDDSRDKNPKYLEAQMNLAWVAARIASGD